MSPMPPLCTYLALVLIDEDVEHSDSSYDEQSSKKQKHLRIIILDGNDLSCIILTGRRMIPSRFLLLTLCWQKNASRICGATSDLFLYIGSV